MFRTFTLTFLITSGILFLAKFAILRNKILADPEIVKHVDIFLYEQKKHGVKLPTFYGLRIEFSPAIVYPTIATSFDPKAKTDKLILVNRVLWNILNDAERTELIAHELGHSLLHRDHRPGFMAKDAPVSIMHPNLFFGTTFLKHKKYYWNELFSIREDLPY